MDKVTETRYIQCVSDQLYTSFILKKDDTRMNWNNGKMFIIKAYLKFLMTVFSFLEKYRKRQLKNFFGKHICFQLPNTISFQNKRNGQVI